MIRQSCGFKSGVFLHRTLGEPLCEACRAVAADMNRTPAGEEALAGRRPRPWEPAQPGYNFPSID